MMFFQCKTCHRTKGVALEPYQDVYTENELELMDIKARRTRTRLRIKGTSR